MLLGTPCAKAQCSVGLGKISNQWLGNMLYMQDFSSPMLGAQGVEKNGEEVASSSEKLLKSLAGFSVPFQLLKCA